MLTTPTTAAVEPMATGGDHVLDVSVKNQRGEQVYRAGWTTTLTARKR